MSDLTGKIALFISITLISAMSGGCLGTTEPKTSNTSSLGKTTANKSITADSAPSKNSIVANAENTPDKPTKTPEQLGPVQNVSNDELKKLIEKGVTLIDIRRSEEWADTGTIKGSKRLTFFDAGGIVKPEFFREIDNVVAKGKPIILIGRSGYRARVAGEMLARSGGYGRIYNVTKGITGWIDEKQPVVKE